MAFPFLADDRLRFWSWLYSLASDASPREDWLPGQSPFDLGSYRCVLNVYEETANVARLKALPTQDGRRDRTARDLEKTEREIRRVIEAIKAGVPGAAVKDAMASLESRRIDLLGQFENTPPPTPRLHPNLAELYRQKVMNLAEALNEEDTRLEAAECIRELIEEIRLVPKRGELEIELYGELANRRVISHSVWMSAFRHEPEVANTELNFR
jgi:hypothetical protein